LIAGYGSKGKPLGSLRPATARLLENIFGYSIDELLAPPVQATSSDSTSAKIYQRRDASGRTDGAVTIGRPEQPVGLRSLNRQSQNINTAPARTDHAAVDLTVFFDWLDEHAGWIRDTTRPKVTSRLAKMDMRGLVDQCARRAKVSRSQIAHFLSEYYGDRARGAGVYHARCGGRKVETSIIARPEWLDLACPLTQGNDQLTLVKTVPDSLTPVDDLRARRAVVRLAEAVALNVRVANMPLYRLLNIEVKRGAVSIGHGDTVLRDQLIEDLDRLLPA
jgi:hypothetical protein